jgi:predicted nucleic acid-binding protein
MPELFFDTAGWGHLVDPSQAFHRNAAAVYRRVTREGRRVVTTNYVLAELVALLTHPLKVSRPALIEFIESLRASPYVEVLHIDPTLDAEAWRLLAGRRDKEWSLVDCASFVVMRERRITEALTTDHNFEQAGFVILLKG